MGRDALIVAVIGAGAAYLLMRQARASDGVDQSIDQTVLDARDALATGTSANSESINEAGTSWVDDLIGSVTDGWSNMTTTWNESLIPAQYLAQIRDAERAYGLPYNLLARVLYQESHYRQDIITGQKTSSAGALGIAQFMPATAAELGIDPLDPDQAIPASAKYLASLYKSTGQSWVGAVAAYNWGIGNVLKKGLGRAPVETQQYYKSILADIGMPTTTG